MPMNESHGWGPNDYLAGDGIREQAWDRYRLVDQPLLPPDLERWPKNPVGDDLMKRAKEHDEKWADQRKATFNPWMYPHPPLDWPAIVPPAPRFPPEVTEQKPMRLDAYLSPLTARAVEDIVRRVVREEIAAAAARLAPPAI